MNTVRCSAEPDATSLSGVAPSAFFVVTTFRPFTFSSVPHVGVPLATLKVRFFVPPCECHFVITPVSASFSKSSSHEASSQ